MTALPPVHILLVNYNGCRDTLECLESLFRLDYPDFRVIVCDNGSTDDSVEHLQRWANGRELSTPPDVLALRHLAEPPVAKPVRYVIYGRAEAERGGTAGADAPLIVVCTGDNLGFAGGNNVGLRYLRARNQTGLVWILNNDTIVESSTLRELVTELDRNPPLAAVGGTLFWYDRPDTVQVAGGWCVSLWNGFSRPRAGNHARFDFISGACILVRLEVLDTVGLLDERYFLYSEEVDWCLRMRRWGLELGYAENARVWHKEGRTMRRQGDWWDYYSVRSSLLLVHKFRPARVPVALMWSIYRCVLPKIARGQWRRLRAVIRAYGDFLGAVFRGRSETPERGIPS